MNVYARLVYRNVRANLDRTSLFFELIFPFFFIFVQGEALAGIIPPFDIGNGKIVSYTLFLAAGAVTLTVINGGTNAGTQLWFDRKNGMFEQILMGPFTKAQYIMSIILATLIIGIAGSLLVFAIALPVLGGGIQITVSGILLVSSALFLGTMFFGAFAIALSVFLRSSESFQIVSTFVFFVFLFTSTIFYPSKQRPPDHSRYQPFESTNVHHRHVPGRSFQRVHFHSVPRNSSPRRGGRGDLFPRDSGVPQDQSVIQDRRHRLSGILIVERIVCRRNAVPLIRGRN